MFFFCIVPVRLIRLRVQQDNEKTILVSKRLEIEAILKTT